MIFSEKCLSYHQPGHPESPERVRIIYEVLKKKGFKFYDCDYCSEEDLLLCHTRSLINSVKSGDFYDVDTPNLTNIFDYARLAVGGALKALEIAFSKGAAFSLLRPPGHHAGRNFLGGFCYFNNIAIAVRKSGKRCAIIDIDCHHGNGTEDIFLGDKNVLYTSIHRNGFFYPGTGIESRENCINYPLRFPSEADWLRFFDELIEKVKEFNPDFIAVSAGFDAYEGDPIGNLGLKVETYEIIGKKVGEIKKPVLCVLEGGYSEKIGECVYNFLRGLKCSI